MSVSGILLAAGQSLRFGGETKQLLDFAGEPVIRRVAVQACQSLLGEVVVVVGHRAGAVEAALAGLDLRSVRNARYREGLSRSIAVGIGSVDRGAEAALFMTADQPLLTKAVINRIVSRYIRTGAAIVVPCFEGQRGSPVLFDRQLFADLQALRKDRGGREIIRRCPELVEVVELKNGRALADMDTLADYRHLLGYTMDQKKVEQESEC